jgi:hypothetical protein
MLTRRHCDTALEEQPKAGSTTNNAPEHTISAAAQAEAWLAARFPGTAPPTKYLAGFQLGGGRELAIERTRQTISVWVPRVPDGLTGCRLRNLKSPGQPYAASQSRNSNLRSVAPTLATGHEACHVELDDLGVLARLTELI